MGRKVPVICQRPDADRLRGPAVDQNRPVVPRGMDENFFPLRKLEIQRAGDEPPRLVMVRLRLRAGKRPGQENLAAEARKTKSFPGVNQFQKQMVARVSPARGKADIKPASASRPTRRPISNNGQRQT